MPKVSTFPSASTPLANADVLYAIQGGNSRKTTVGDIFTAPAFDTEIETKIETKFGVTGAAPVFACRAWVNFNGMGVVAIRASGNVSSITDNGTGDYTVNFTDALPDGNYAMCGFSVANSTSNVAGASVVTLAPTGVATHLALLKSTTQVRILVGNPSAGNPVDSGDVSVSIFR